MKAFLQSHWKLVLIINLLLGIVLWLDWFTNISLRGEFTNILFPLIVAFLALITLEILPAEKKRLGVFASIPSCGGGCLYLLVGFMMLIPPFTLYFLFRVSEIADEVRVQQIISPNRINFADVYFQPVGAYGEGSGRIYIRVQNKFLPFIERDLYSGTTYMTEENLTDYVQWLDDSTLYISETSTRISIGNVKFELPSIIKYPLLEINFFQNQTNGTNQPRDNP